MATPEQTAANKFTILLAFCSGDRSSLLSISKRFLFKKSLSFWESEIALGVTSVSFTYEDILHVLNALKKTLDINSISLTSWIKWLSQKRCTDD